MPNNNQTNGNQKNTIERNVSKEKLVETIANIPLDEISVNPFINRPKFSLIDYIRFYGFGSIVMLIRIIPLGLTLLMASLLSSLFVNLIKILDLSRISTKKFKLIAKHIVYGIVRCSLWFAGFYWIQVTDKSTENQSNITKPTIIPIAPHSTFWDMVAMIKLGVPSIVSRYENSKIYFIGSIISLCEPVYVKRDETQSRLKAADDIKARALVGDIMLFPEGTCTNTKSLIQFKLGAFLPQLPVQPVVIKWHNGKYDLRSWVEEGTGALKLIFFTLAQMWNSCQIIILEPYIPNEEEKKDIRLFADNVERVMCEELGVLQSYYSYDDVMFMGFANEIRIFRSPVCIKLLKVCYKILKEQSTHDIPGDSLSKRIKAPKFAPIFSPTYLGLGEDFEHISSVPDFYIPKALLKMTKKKKERFKQKKRDSSDAKRLPMSGVVRNTFDASQTIPQIAVTSKIANEKRLVYETFGTFVEKSINNMEESGEIRAIESTQDLAKLLGLDESSKINKSSSLVDLLKAIEFRTSEGPTTLHLLTALHLCDCREPNLWERIRAAINLLSLHMKASKSEEQLKSDTESEPKLDLHHFKTFLWYSLGLQQFDEQFLTEKDFDFEYIKKNMKNIFKKAVSENAQSLD